MIWTDPWDEEILFCILACIVPWHEVNMFVATFLRGLHCFHTGYWHETCGKDLV